MIEEGRIWKTYNSQNKPKKQNTQAHKITEKQTNKQKRLKTKDNKKRSTPQQQKYTKAWVNK